MLEAATISACFSGECLLSNPLLVVNNPHYSTPIPSTHPLFTISRRGMLYSMTYPSHIYTYTSTYLRYDVFRIRISENTSPFSFKERLGV